MKIKRGDTVMVNTGKDKGKTGEVLSVNTELNRVVVDGINIIKRHVKPTQAQPKGGIIESPAPIHISNVGLVHPEDAKRTSRVGYAFNDKGEKHRVYRQAKNKKV